MRVFELSTHVKSISRGTGGSAIAAAAYRACCAIESEIDGQMHDYTRKQGREASAIVLPANAPAWAADRARLWNEAEARERNGKRGKNAGQLKQNASLAREFMFSFPAELSEAGRFKVAEIVARHLADTHGIAADFSIHRPGREGDERNYHCHMLTTTRRMTAKGLGAKAREWDDLKKRSQLAKQFRAFVAETMNAPWPTRVTPAPSTSSIAVSRRAAAARSLPGIRASTAPTCAAENASLRGRRGSAMSAAASTSAICGNRPRPDPAGRRACRKDPRPGRTRAQGHRRHPQALAGIRRPTRTDGPQGRGPEGDRPDGGRRVRPAGPRTQRIEQAERDIAALKASLKAEANSFALEQGKEATALRHRHTGEGQQLLTAASARRDLTARPRFRPARARKEHRAGAPARARTGRPGD